MSKSFQIIRTIYSDQVGSTYEAIDNITEKRVMLRRFNSTVNFTDTSFSEKAFISLGEKLATISHSSITNIYETGFDDNGAYLSMEFSEEGLSIEEILNKRKRLCNEDFFVMACQVLKAFAHIHSKGVYHGALNGNSIQEFKNKERGTYYKCVDLGVSILLPLIDPQLPKLILNDPALTAPELFEGLAPDQRSDIYMIGQLFFLSLAGGHPLAGVPADEAYDRHKNSKIGPLSGYRSTVSEEVVNWIRLLTQADPDSRPESIEHALLLMPRDLTKCQEAEGFQEYNKAKLTGSIYTNANIEKTPVKSTEGRHTLLIILLAILLCLYFYFFVGNR